MSDDVDLEHVGIKLPLGLTTMVRLMEAIDKAFPGAVWVKDHDMGDDHLVIGVRKRQEDDDAG